MIEASLIVSIFILLILLFYSGKVGIDTASLFVLTLFLLLELLTPKEAFSGFASDAVVLMIGSFFLSCALKMTGVDEKLGSIMVRFSRKSELRSVAIVMIIGATISSVINNMAAVAVLLPAVANLSKRAQVPAYKLYIPLSFSVLIGGTTTLIGTSSNLIASEALVNAGYKNFTLLEFLPAGLLLFVVGFLYFCFAGRFILGWGRKESAKISKQSLVALYKLKERMFGIKLPNNSKLNNVTLKDSGLNNLIDIEVLAIKRYGNIVHSINPEDKLLGNDTLYVRGRSQEVKQVLKLSHGAICDIDQHLTTEELERFSVVKFSVTKSLLAKGSTLAEIHFRHHTGLHVAKILGDRVLIGEELPHSVLKIGDKLIAYGPSESIPNLKKIGIAPEDISISRIEDQEQSLIFGFLLPDGSLFEGAKVRELGFQEILGITVIAIKRGEELHLSTSGNDTVNANDLLVVVGDSASVNLVMSLSSATIIDEVPDIELEADNLVLQEVLLSPRSKLIGKSLEEVQFYAQYGLKVLSLWRNGEPKRTRFSNSPLAFGDTMLVRGTNEKFTLLSKDSDFVLLSTEYIPSLRRNKAVWAYIALFLLISLSAMQIFPTSLVALIVSITLVLSGTIKMEEAYREIDWRLIILVAAILPFQILLPRYGITDVIAQGIVHYSDVQSVFYVTLIFVALSSVVSQLLDSTIAVVILAPIAITFAEQHGIVVQPLVMAVAIGASLGFMTPMAHRAHLLIRTPGGYSVKDFIRVGFLLTIFTVIAASAICASGMGLY